VHLLILVYNANERMSSTILYELNRLILHDSSFINVPTLDNRSVVERTHVYF